MSIPSINRMQSPSVSGPVAIHPSHYKKSSPAITTDASPAAREPLASAIAAALTQLGLIPGASTTDANSPAKTGDTPPASFPLQQRSTQQVQNYRNTASTSSGLAQALSATRQSNASHADTLPTVFQSLWTSLGAASGMPADSSSRAIPSLPSFLNMLARNLSESGLTGLRGLFVDTVARPSGQITHGCEVVQRLVARQTRDRIIRQVHTKRDNAAFQLRLQDAAITHRSIS